MYKWVYQSNCHGYRFQVRSIHSISMCAAAGKGSLSRATEDLFATTPCLFQQGVKSPCYRKNGLSHVNGRLSRLQSAVCSTKKIITVMTVVLFSWGSSFITWVTWLYGNCAIPSESHINSSMDKESTFISRGSVHNSGQTWRSVIIYNWRLGVIVWIQLLK